MTARKRLFFMQLAGLILAFLVLEWLAGVFTARASLPYALSLLAYILPTLPLFGIIPLSLNYTNNNPDLPLSAHRMAPVRRYMVRMGVSMFFYVIILMASIVALDRFELSVQIKALLAVLTALPIGGIIWAVSRLIADPDVDEFERMIMTRSVMASAALTFFFAAIWGFLENFAEAPDFPLYLVVVVYFGLFGLVQPFVRRGFR